MLTVLAETAAQEGKKTILAMLIVGLVFLSVIALGELTHWLPPPALSAMQDLRDWIAVLEREGELVRVTAEVDPDLEITEIVDRTVKAGGPALLFENPRARAIRC